MNSLHHQYLLLITWERNSSSIHNKDCLPPYLQVVYLTFSTGIAVVSIQFVNKKKIKINICFTVNACSQWNSDEHQK